MEPTKLCLNCEELIPESKFVLHERFCANNVKKCQICKEIINIEDEQEHINEYHTKVNCIHCKKLFEKDKLEGHQSECDEQLDKCQYCQLDISKKEKINHEYICGAKTELCPKCNEYIQLKELEAHSLKQCKPKEVKKEIQQPKRSIANHDNNKEKDRIVPSVKVNGFNDRQYPFNSNKQEDAALNKYVGNINDIQRDYKQPKEAPIESGNLIYKRNQIASPQQHQSKPIQDSKQQMIEKTQKVLDKKKYESTESPYENYKGYQQNKKIVQDKKPYQAANYQQALRGDYISKYNKNEPEPISPKHEPTYNYNYAIAKKELNQNKDIYHKKNDIIEARDPREYRSNFQIPVKDQSKVSNISNQKDIKTKPQPQTIDPPSKKNHILKQNTNIIKDKPKENIIRETKSNPFSHNHNPAYWNKYQDDCLPDDIMDFQMNNNHYPGSEYLTTEDRELDAVILQSLKSK